MHHPGKGWHWLAEKTRVVREREAEDARQIEQQRRANATALLARGFSSIARSDKPKAAAVATPVQAPATTSAPRRRKSVAS